MDRNKLQERIDTIHEKCAELQKLSISFADTGNSNVSRILMNIVDEITVSTIHIRKEIDDDLDKQFQKSINAVAETLKAVCNKEG